MQPRSSRTFSFLAMAGCAGIAALVLDAVPSGAQEVEIRLRPTGAMPPSSMGFGRGANLPDMTFDERGGAYFKTVQVEHIEPETYEIAIVYGEKTQQLPLELHRSSRPVNLRVKFDGPPFCREILVKEAERPAQPGNIAQALERYLLAVHLSEITEEAGRCRESQPDRLRRARIERGIQLATFRGSPFLPPENDPEEWAEIIGRDRARIYSRQVRQASAIALERDRRAAIEQRDFAAAAQVNSVILAQRAESPDNETTWNDVGLTERRLLADQRYLESRARSLGQNIENATVMAADAAAESPES